MFKEFLMKKMLERQLKDLPRDKQEQLLRVIGENPELFERIGKSIETKVKSGTDQKTAALQVATEFRTELSSLLK